MNCKYVFGPNAGQTCHVPRDQFIDILIKSGVLEIADDQTPRQPVTVPAPTPKWGIKKMPTSGEVVIQCDHLNTTMYYRGDPANAHTFKVGGFAPPDEVLHAYALQWKSAAGLANEMEVNYERQRQAKERS
jgi:hypothetical protein